MNPDREPAPDRPKRRTARIVAIGVGLAVAAYVGLYFFANTQLRNLLPTAVATAVGGEDSERYVVTVGTVRLSPWLGGLTVRDLAIAVDSAAAAGAAEPALVRSASVRSFRVSGIRLIPLIRGKGIFISSIEIDRPTAELHFPAPAETDPPDVQEPSAEEAAEEAGGFQPPTAILQRIRITDASVGLTRETGFGTARSVLHGLDIELTDIRIDSVSATNPARALANSRVRIAFDSAAHLLDDSLYVIDVARLRADSRDSVVEIGAFRLTPTLEAAPFFGRLSQRADRLNISTGPIRLEGLDFRRYFAEDALRVRLIDVDSLDLHVYADIQIPWGPRARPCRYHMGFATVEVPFAIDTIRLEDSRIRYSELSKGSVRPGELTLEELNGVVVNLTNDPEKMTHETPAVAHVTAKLFGEGAVEATVAYPLLSKTLDFSVEASLGPMNMPTFNQFASNVAGVEIKKGRLDSLWFRTESRGGRAGGRVHMRYRDLDFRIFDKKSGKEMPWHTVAGFLGNLVVRSNNPGKPGQAPRDGKIGYTCGKNDIVFFEYLVGALASALKGIVIG